jgi:hypothetical protein
MEIIECLTVSEVFLDALQLVNAKIGSI